MQGVQAQQHKRRSQPTVTSTVCSKSERQKQAKKTCMDPAYAPRNIVWHHCAIDRDMAPLCQILTSTSWLHHTHELPRTKPGCEIMNTMSDAHRGMLQRTNTNTITLCSKGHRAQTATLLPDCVNELTHVHTFTTHSPNCGFNCRAENQATRKRLQPTPCLTLPKNC